MNGQFSLFDDPAQRIASDWAFAKTQVAAWQSQGDTIVFTNGCFDLLHVGHLTYLSQARQLGERLVVGLNADASVKLLKGEQRPLQTASDRAFNLAALRAVDLVVVFEEETPLQLIRYLRPNVLVKGGDYTVATIVGAEEVMENGGQVKVLPFVNGKSTTALIHRMDGQS
jgi:D-beta-D-heptose 7-phosphate kinase/D-beta-D-heptose 1-phosphate adenosyltransferase